MRSLLLDVHPHLKSFDSSDTDYRLAIHLARTVHVLFNVHYKCDLQVDIWPTLYMFCSTFTTSVLCRLLKLKRLSVAFMGHCLNLSQVMSILFERAYS
jgi:hypothetical protein